MPIARSRIRARWFAVVVLAAAVLRPAAAVAAPQAPTQIAPPPISVNTDDTAPAGDTVVVEPPRVAPMGTTTVIASGFAPSAVIAVILQPVTTRLARAYADTTGTVRATVTLPPEIVAGSYDVVVSGNDPAGNERTVSGALTVTEFANTGLDPWVLLVIGLATIVVGRSALDASAWLRRRLQPAVITLPGGRLFRLRLVPRSRVRIRLRVRR
jgi:hypothetical protein